MDWFTSLALTVVLMAVGFWVLYLVVRSAVLWALRAHAEDVSRASHRATEADTADR